MGKLYDDAKAVADAAEALVSEATIIEAEQGDTTVGEKTVTKVTVTYSDGSSVDFTDNTPGNAAPAPVVSPVTDDTPSTSAGETGSSSETDSGSGTESKELPEGGTEVQPSVAGTIPEQD